MPSLSCAVDSRGSALNEGRGCQSQRKALRVQGDEIQLLHWTDEELESQGHLVAVRCLDSGPSDLKPASLPGTHA